MNQVWLQQQYNVFYTTFVYVPVYVPYPVIQNQMYIQQDIPKPPLPRRTKQIIEIIDPKTLKPINVTDNKNDIGTQVEIIKKIKTKSVRLETDFKIILKFNASTQTVPYPKCSSTLNIDAAANDSAISLKKGIFYVNTYTA